MSEVVYDKVQPGLDSIQDVGIDLNEADGEAEVLRQKDWKDGEQKTWWEEATAFCVLFGAALHILQPGLLSEERGELGTILETVDSKVYI